LNIDVTKQLSRGRRGVETGNLSECRGLVGKHKVVPGEKKRSSRKDTTTLPNRHPEKTWEKRAKGKNGKAATKGARVKVEGQKEHQNGEQERACDLLNEEDYRSQSIVTVEMAVRKSKLSNRDEKLEKGATDRTSGTAVGTKVGAIGGENNFRAEHW